MTGANWGGSAPLPGDDLVFPDLKASAFVFNDFPAGTTFRSIHANGNSYTLTGQSLALGSQGLTVTGHATMNDMVITAGPASIEGILTMNGGSFAGPVNVTSGGIELYGSVSTGPLTMGPNTQLAITNFAPSERTTVASLKLDPTSSMGILLAPSGNASPVRSMLTVTGSVDLGGAATEILDTAMPFPGGTTLRIIDNTGPDPVKGMFAGLPEGASTFSAFHQRMMITYAGGTGNDVELIAQTALPSTAILTAFPNPAFPDQPVTLMATVTVPGGSATGKVLFYETLPKGADRSIDSADLDEHGVASISHTWPDVGTRWVIASYPGGDGTTLSFSNELTLTIVPQTTRRRSARH